MVTPPFSLVGVVVCVVLTNEKLCAAFSLPRCFEGLEINNIQKQVLFNRKKKGES